VASVIFKITVTLLSKVGWVRFPHSPATALLAGICVFALAMPTQADSQQRDSARAGIAAPQSPTHQPIARDTTPKPPLSPRRAFLTSLILPGYAQTVFGRDKAAMLFAVVEIGSIGMVRKAAIDLADAERLPRDSVVATYKIDSNTGLAVIDPRTGLPVPDTYIASRFTDDRIKARRTHYEDWIAALVFNHLFSGADAYVAANLWDFNTNIGVVATPRSAGVYASVRLR
jgi:hypothetical protein